MPNSPSPGEGSDSLSSFIEEVAGPDSIRIEEDFGQGFVRLRSSEAERRQATQDIRSSEDVIIELLRNSRDAGAANIYIATGKTADERFITVIDDGCGIPLDMRDRIFQPRVTSKLDSAHMDKWGLHGRGMALFSIAENSRRHGVVYSSEGEGSSIGVTLSSEDVTEKKDQSTFPYFDIVDGVLLMRGPKNIVRVVCEFAIENRDALNVYIGSATEITATLYRDGVSKVPAKERIFSSTVAYEGPAEMMSFAGDPDTMSELAAKLGLDISSRSARRVLDGEIEPLSPVIEQVEEALVFHEGRKGSKSSDEPNGRAIDVKSYFNPRITHPDMREFSEAISKDFDVIRDKYYLKEVEPKISVRRGKITIELDLVEDDGE